MDIEKCSEKINHKNILVKEKKSSQITFSNPQLIEVTKIQVDDSLDIQGLKCDWLLIVNPPQFYIEIYIELKGKDVEHGLKQIKNTIKILSQNPTKCRKYCYIITTRCPLSSPEIQNLKKKFLKTYNAVLKVQKTGCTENINSLIPGN
ncbi:MAG: hypothetical protein QNJ47_13505 [Nostocaceae cyanobacterium]|nr:hypothetical protein [Nostocaceae cyanobacterium]